MLNNLNEKLGEVVENAKETFENLTENVDLGDLKDTDNDVLEDVFGKAKEMFSNFTK